MKVTGEVRIDVPGKGEYENCFEDGIECEYLNGVGLKDGCYCKHYTRARDWSDSSVLDEKGKPHMQHYCKKKKSFLGFSYCCGQFANCFEMGKSAGVKRITNKIRKQRED